MKIKKYFSVILAVVLLLSSAMPVFGSTQEPAEWYEMEEDDFSVPDQNDDIGGIMPRSQYVNTVRTGIYDLGSRKVGLRAEVYCSSVVSSIKTTFYLQKKVNGAWNTVSTGSVSTTNSNSMIKSMSVTGVSAGTYRAQTYTVVSKGGYTETVTGYSSGSITIS